MKIKIVSFGFKYGDPPSGNLVFDVRFAKNPHYVPELKPLTGADPAVAIFVLQQPSSEMFLLNLQEMLWILISGYAEHGHDHETVTIAFGCTGGKHRSVCFALQAKRILDEFIAQGDLEAEVAVEHRDLGRE